MVKVRVAFAELLLAIGCEPSILLLIAVCCLLAGSQIAVCMHAPLMSLETRITYVSGFADSCTSHDRHWMCCWVNRATSGLHFLELVSLDALVAALAEDAPQVPPSTKSAQMLMMSFWSLLSLGQAWVHKMTSSIVMVKPLNTIHYPACCAGHSEAAEAAAAQLLPRA